MRANQHRTIHLNIIVQYIKSLKCPFCSNQIKDISDKMSCPECHAEFEIDDRGECVFVDTDYPRLPLEGIFCNSCGLVQDEGNKSCAYCGSRIELTYH